jgi:hypothetical protein
VVYVKSSRKFQNSAFLQISLRIIDHDLLEKGSSRGENCNYQLKHNWAWLQTKEKTTLSRSSGTKITTWDPVEVNSSCKTERILLLEGESGNPKVGNGIEAFSILLD